jgi:cold shock CspA family protein
MAKGQRDLREYLTAYDAREHLPELASWMDDDLLKQLTLWRGGRLVAGDTYFDLDNPARGPFVVTGDERPITDHTYVAHSQAGEQAWIALTTWRQPIDESQGEALARQIEEVAPGPTQSAAGDARPRPEPSTEPHGKRHHGTVDRLIPDRGFGFIADDDGSEYFFHRTALQATRLDDLAPGTPVTFALGSDPGDQPDEHLRAVSVRLAEEALPAVDGAMPGA